MKTPSRLFKSSNLILWILPLLFLGIFFFFPLAKITQLSFARAEGGFLAGLWNALNTPTVSKVVGFTFKQAFCNGSEIHTDKRIRLPF